MWTIKAFLGVSNLLLKIVIVVATAGTENGTFVEEMPVYWVDESELVCDEYVDINLDVNILSPCELNAFPPGFNKSQQEVDKLRLECGKKYHEMFLLPLAGLYHCAYEEQEIMPIETGNKNVSVKLALLVGYGSIYSHSSLNGDDDISKMKLGNVRREDVVKIVESKLSEEGSFADILMLPGLMGNHSQYYSRREYLPTLQTFWRYGKFIPEEFLQVIGIDDFRKAFGDVLLKSVETPNCSFDLNWTNLKVTFTLPKVNRALRVFHAVPFDLIDRFDDFSCELKYNGTQTVIWSTEQNCIVAKNVTEPKNMIRYGMDENAFFAQSNSCIPMSNEDTPYFDVSACYKARTRLSYYLGSRSMNQSYYVYCNVGFVNYPTEDDPAIPCPPFVFRTNESLPIYLNGDRKPTYWSSDVLTTIIPESLTVNRMLFPVRINTTAIMMSQIPINRESRIPETETFVLLPAAITMLIIMGSIILVMILLALLYVFRKFVFTNTNGNRVVPITFWRNPI